jgi:hypothetical protein
MQDAWWALSQFLSEEKQIFINSYYINEDEPRSYLIFIIFKMYYHNPMFQPVVHPQSGYFPVGQQFSSDYILSDNIYFIFQ